MPRRDASRATKGTDAPPPQSEAASTIDGMRGVFRLGSRVKDVNGAEEPVDLGTLHVFPSVQDEPTARPGQWALCLTPEPDGAPRRNLLIEVASRLGIAPVHFTAKFEEALRSDAPMALVADTNALYHGTLAQALRVRGGRATHVAVADQAFMEMQRQRELGHNKKRPVVPAGVASAAPGANRTGGGSTLPPSAPGIPSIPVPSPIDRWANRVRRARFLAAGGRALKQLRVAGYIVHTARPPEAMVRYFGGSRGGGEGDGEHADNHSERQDDLVGANALRDRLILEAVVQHRVELPGVTVWLVTDDALLAEQAQIEGLSVGFGWLTERLDPPVLSSPFINPRTFRLTHVHVGELLEELVWSCEVVTIQRPEEGRMLVGRAPHEKRLRVLAAMDEPGHGVRWAAENAPPRTQIQTPSIGVVQSVPRKAPPPQRMLARLLELSTGASGAGQSDNEDEQTIDAYIRALGWMDNENQVTERGRALADSWLRLTETDVAGWVSWMLDASQDLDRLPTLTALLKKLETRPGATDEALHSLTGESRRTLSAQLNLASAMGRAVRLGGKTWQASAWDAVEAEDAVLSAIQRVAARSPGTYAASIARVFTSFLPKKGEVPSPRPMALPIFRGALQRLHGAGRVHLSGSSPERSEVKLRVLVPTGGGADPHVTSREIDLGYGDFLIPGIPCAVASLPAEQS